MQKVSIKKFSVLGLVLIAASAVTAAVLPKDSKETRQVQGELFPTTADGNQINGTCRAGSALNCVISNTVTSENGLGNITSTNNRVEGNTSTVVNTSATPN